nr:glycosyltransferase [uncultured Acetatifactor sp.]
MEGILITIVVPVYNVEKYIEACLYSIMKQTYKNIEVVIVDDGSTDKSGDICDDFSKIDSRAKVVHQSNIGLSGARNKGISIASGKYITFVDSDDLLYPTYIEKLCNAINGCDISMCDFDYVSEDFRILNDIISDNRKIHSFYWSNVDAIREVYATKYHGVDFIACAKLYKLTLFSENGIIFPEGRLHEDTFTTYKLFYAAKKISYNDEKLYLYRQRRGSITRSGFNKRKLDSIDATREECEFFLERNEMDLLVISFYDYLHKTKALIREMMKDRIHNKSEIKEVCMAIRLDIEKYGKLIKIPKKKKIYYSAISHFPVIATL